MFAGRSSSTSKTHASLSSSVVGLALLCSTFLIVLDIDHVTAMSLDRLALERNEILDHQPQQQQHPEEPTLVVDDMELEALPAHGDTDMYVLLPVGSDGVDKNIIDYAAEMDAADHGGDMLMMESNDEPAMQMVQMPELLAELQRDSDESDDVEEESAAVNQPEEAAVPASESNETENSEEPVKESIEEAVEKVEEPAQEFTELQEELVEKVEEPAEESIDTTTPIALMLAEMAQQQAAEAQASEEADLAPMAMQDPVDEETQALENGEVEQTDEAVTEGKLEIPMPEESMNSEMVDEAAAEMTTEKIDEVEAESMAQIIAEAVEEAEEAMEAEAEAVTEAEVQSVISGDQDDENEVPSDTQEETTAAYVEQTDETMAEVSSNELLKEPMNEEVVDEESITEAVNVAQSAPEAVEDAVIPGAVESLADAAPIETEDQAVAESEIDSTTVAPLEIDAEAETVEETANVVSEQLESEAHNDDDEEEVKVEPEAHMDDVENEVEPESHIVPGDIQVEDEETKAEDEIKVDEQPIALDQVVPEAANEPEEIHGEPEIEDLKQDDEDVAISQEESHVEDAETHEEKQEESPIVDEEKDNQAETQVAEESLPEAEEQKGEQQPAEEQKEEEQPAEEQKEEEQPAQEQHEAEEQPAEEQKEEEQPAEEQKEEEQPAAEQQEEEQPAEEQKVEEQPSEKQPAEEQKEEEQSAEPQQEEEQPAEEQPAEEQPAEEHREEEHQEEEQLTEEQSQAASEQNVEEAKAPQEETPKEEDSVIPPSPDSTISLDEVAESGADVTQEHETEEVQAQAEQEIIAETPEETEQETLESHDLTADDDDSAPVLAEEPAQENLPTEAEKDPQMEAEIPAAEVHEVNEVETVAEEAVNKVEEEEKKPAISMDAAANQNEVAQETQESIKEPQNTDLNSMLTTIVQVPQPQQQSQQQQQQQESELPSTVDEVPTKVENVAVMQPTIQMPMPAPQGASIGSTNQKPLNVMDSVLNYVNASFLNNNNEKNQQKPQDDGDSFSSKLRRYDGAQVWRIVVQNDRDKKLADQLQTKFDGQLWKEVKAEVDYLLKPQVLADAEKHIRAANLSRIVLIDNLQKVIEVENPPAEEIAQLQNRKGHRMTWQAYHRLADIHGFFDYLAKTYPDICSVETIGYSIQKRQLKILKISNGNAGNPGVWIDGGMHAREWISPASVTYIANQIVEGWDDLPSYMRNVNWYIHAVANPDGYEYSHTTDRLWRKNMRSHGRQCPGVDLNRNFGYKWGGKGTSANPCAQTYRGSNAFSEPETFYISKYISNFPRDTFQAYLSFHSYGQYILYPWGYDYQLTKDRADLDRVARQAGTIITRSSGVKYTVGASATTLYPAAGGSDDWAKGFAGIKYAYTIEMGDTGRYGFVLPASMIESNGKDGYTFVQTVARAVTNTDMHSRKRSF